MTKAVAIVLLLLAAIPATANDTSTVERVADRQSFVSSPDEERALVAQIKTLSETYFENLFDGNYEVAYALLSDHLKSYFTFDEWSARMDSTRAQIGSVSAINVHKITVYDNPANAPEPGLYIAADYQNSFEKARYYCGYLLWFRGQSGEFRITREENALVTNEVLERGLNEDRAALLNQMRCTAGQ